MDYKNIIKASFRDILETNTFDESKISTYFHPNYTQHVDGKTLNYEQFIAHAKTLRNTITSIKITFEHLIQEGHSVCSVHIAEALKPDGNKVRAKVIAYFEFQDGQIILCDELTHLLEGEKSDADLGSRH